MSKRREKFSPLHRKEVFMETITNFRDLGGIQTREGKVILPNKLLRSGELSRVSIQEQVQLLEDYQLGKIIDLRSQDEVEERPDMEFENTSYRHIDIFKDKEDEGTGLDDFKEIATVEAAKKFMNDTYYIMATNRGAQVGFSQLIEESLSIAASKNSVLFHCFAGKDRTGISAALLLEILEVPKESIYTDYMATNRLRVKENDELIQLAQANGLNAESTSALRVALNVEEEYLDTFYQTVKTEFGSIKDYLSDQLNITLSMQQDLRSLLLTDA